MITVFRFKSYTATEIDSLVTLMTRNGYTVKFEKGDRVAIKVTISKDGEEGIAEDIG